jgi:hypothetical protein
VIARSVGSLSPNSAKLIVAGIGVVGLGGVVGILVTLSFPYEWLHIQHFSLGGLSHRAAQPAQDC